MWEPHRVIVHLPLEDEGGDSDIGLGLLGLFGFLVRHERKSVSA